MQPTVFNSIENFNNLMAMRVFVEACEQWNYENKTSRYEVSIKRMYFDYGQNWEYTGFVTRDTDTDDGTLGSWQSLCPRDWELVVTETNIDRIIAMAWFYMDNLQKPYSERKSLYERF
jgi:hypothetical protein